MDYDRSRSARASSSASLPALPRPSSSRYARGTCGLEDRAVLQEVLEGKPETAEQAFYMVGTIEDAIAKAKRLA